MKGKVLVLVSLTMLVVSMILMLHTAIIAQTDDPAPAAWLVELKAIAQAQQHGTIVVQAESTEEPVFLSGDQQSQFSCEITGRASNIRFEPNTTSQIWGSLSTTIPSEGTVVGSDGYTWFQIMLNDQVYFLRGDVVLRGEGCPQVVAPQAVQEVVAQATPEPQQQAEQQVQQEVPQVAQPTLVPTQAPVQPTPEPPPPESTRRDASQHGETDENGNVFVAFSAGEAVAGAFIRLDDGRVAENCYIASAPSGGKVYGGVVNPWDNEIGSTVCSFA